MVDRKRQPVSSFFVAQEKAPVTDDDFFLWRQEVNTIAFDFNVMLGLLDRKVAMTRQKFVHHAAKIRRQVLNHNECHARVRRQIFKELLQRFETPSRSSDTNNPEPCSAGFRTS